MKNKTRQEKIRNIKKHLKRLHDYEISTIDKKIKKRFLRDKTGFEFTDRFISYLCDLTCEEALKHIKDSLKSENYSIKEYKKISKTPKVFSRYVDKKGNKYINIWKRYVSEEALNNEFTAEIREEYNIISVTPIRDGEVAKVKFKSDKDKQRFYLKMKIFKSQKMKYDISDIERKIRF